MGVNPWARDVGGTGRDVLGMCQTTSQLPVPDGVTSTLGSAGMCWDFPSVGGGPDVMCRGSVLI